ncbi:MAG: hypothetical protein ACYSUT_07555 [Planctomycetota bacterium]
MRVQQYYSITLIVLLIAVSSGFAVTSVITRHSSGVDFLPGETEQTVISSSGTIRLAPPTKEIDLDGQLDDVWSIHAMMTDEDGAIYLGTGPDAKVLRYGAGLVQQVYPIEEDNTEANSEFSNRHVFAMGKDLAGRLLVGVSGETGQLVRLAQKTSEVVFEDERVRYIFAIAQDDDNNVYLGTGPEGLIFKLDPFCQNAKVLYDALDNNILSLIVHAGTVYAGSDRRGLVYKIDPATKRAAVLYDADQDEIASLAVDKDGNLYAAATSAAAAMLQLKVKGTALRDAPGRLDSNDTQGFSESTALNTANGEEEKKQTESKPAQPAPQPASAKAAGHIYRITPDGFVTDVFSEVAVFYGLLNFDGKLWLGTGNQGQLFTVDPATEEKAIYYEDETSSQITSMMAAGEDLYLGLSNPPRLVRMGKGFTDRGVYTSDLIDAGQPARWGKLQIEALIPEGCQILMASRSGNVKEPNDPTFSEWTVDTPVTDAVDLGCPLGRFCQYRLTLTSHEQAVSSEIHEVAAASLVPNLAPKIDAVKLQRSRDKLKPFVQDIGFSASDGNNDTLEFTLEFRKQGRSVWIPLADEQDKTRYEWDSRTVEDGRYEIRVTADDYKSNSTATALKGSRISDPVVIDNTAPEITASKVTVNGDTALLTLAVEDAFTVIGKVQYTVNSNEKWIATLPDDFVYDTRSESFTIELTDLDSGDSVVAVAVSDDLKNTRFQTFEVTID